MCEIRNPGLWNPEYSSRNKKSGIAVTTGIQNPSSRPVMKSGSDGGHGVESGLGCPYKAVADPDLQVREGPGH